MTKTLLNTDDPLTREVLHLMAQVARQEREIAELRQALEALKQWRLDTVCTQLQTSLRAVASDKG